MKRAISYTRVSTDKQQKFGASLDMQATKIAAMVELQDATLIATIEDAESGKSLDRPGIQRIIGMTQRHEFDMLIVYKLDRLTRSVADLDRLVQMFNKHDVALISLGEHIDTGTAGGRMIINLLTVISQWERETIGERTAVVLQHKKTKRQLYNHEPYGYDRINFIIDPKGKKVGGELQANQTEMEIARDLIARRALLSGQPSLRYLATMLNQQGVPAKRGGKWHASAVANVVNNWKLYE